MRSHVQLVDTSIFVPHPLESTVPYAKLDTLEGDILALEEDAFVVAPCSGRLDFKPEVTRPGAIVYSGAVVGRVHQRHACESIVSRFTGVVERALVEPGSKVRPSQPVLWLRKL